MLEKTAKKIETEVEAESRPLRSLGHSMTISRLHPRRHTSRRSQSDWLLASLFVGPLLTVIVIFIYWPIVYSAFISLFDWNFLRVSQKWVGLNNYSELFGNPDFQHALANTGVYLVVLVVIEIAWPLGLALALFHLGRGWLRRLYRVLIFTPTIISFAVAAYLWLWLFNPIQGLINRLLAPLLHDPRMEWVTNANVAIWVVIFVACWKTFGFNFWLFVAALENVPEVYREAARIDGAKGWTMFRYLDWPLISPTSFYVLVTTVIFVGDQSFVAIRVLTQGGPYGASSNVLYALYEQGFGFFDYGKASAIAIMVFGIFSIFTLAQFKFIERQVVYE